MNDNALMRRALRLAAKGWGRTSPNPMVGAVLARDGRELAAGWHRQAGGAHAEVEALENAAEDPRGATLAVTLEPCSTTGRTPPCVESILAAGIARVVIGSRDPNPRHAGRAVDILRSQGVEVVENVERERCQSLNEAFFCWVRHQRPYVLLKLAMTADGKIATAAGESQWITGPASRRRVQKMRRWADAIMVGGETVRRDNPGLLVRQAKKWPRQPLRLVASHSGKLGAKPQVLTDGLAETRVVACRNASEWRELLAALGREEITALLVEGGGELAAMLLNAGLVDKAAFFIAPLILGGRGSRPAVGGPNPTELAAAYRLQETKMTRSGADFMLTGYLSDVHRYH